MEADVGTSNVPTSAIEQRKRAKDGILVVEDAPRVKRQRVSRACDQCRAGKLALTLSAYTLPTRLFE